MKSSTSAVALIAVASLLVGGAVLTAQPANAAGVVSLTSGGCELAIEDLGSSHCGVGVYHGTSKRDEQTTALILTIKTATSTEDTYQGAYTAWSFTGGAITATGSLTTSAGSRFDCTDTYSVQDTTGAIRMQRSVAVGVANASDKGFASRYTDENFLIKESRLALPMTTMRTTSRNAPTTAADARPGWAV